jgi:hypothetical protein
MTQKFTASKKFIHISKANGIPKVTKFTIQADVKLSNSKWKFAEPFKLPVYIQDVEVTEVNPDSLQDILSGNGLKK